MLQKWGFVDVGHVDGHGLAVAQNTIAGDHIDVVTGLGFEVGRRFERDGSTDGIDLKRCGICTAQAVAQCAAGIHIGGLGGVDHGVDRGVFCNAAGLAGCDHRRFVDVGHRDGEVLRDRAAVGAGGFDGDGVAGGGFVVEALACGKLDLIAVQHKKAIGVTH